MKMVVIGMLLLARLAMVTVVTVMLMMMATTTMMNITMTRAMVIPTIQIWSRQRAHLMLMMRRVTTASACQAIGRVAAMFLLTCNFLVQIARSSRIALRRRLVLAGGWPIETLPA